MSPRIVRSTLLLVTLALATLCLAQADLSQAGHVSGTVLDHSGAVVVGAHVTLKQGTLSQETVSGDNGQFSFSSIAPGQFDLTVAASGFATKTTSGILLPNESFLVPTVVLEVATAVTEVQVGVSPVEVAEEQLKVEEKQRVLGVIPNFYVSYDGAHAAPLNSRQKFRLAWKTVIDPVTFGITGIVAGVEQANNSFAGYGTGAEGYAKRFGAAYGDMVSGTMIGGAILPAVLKQDPRYFYKGTGSKSSRFLYALGAAVFCKGDNGHWQPNYSNILGSLAAGGISNLYYPEENRSGAGLTIETGLIGIGSTGAVNVIQEFVIRRFTPSASKHDPAQP